MGHGALQKGRPHLKGKGLGEAKGDKESVRLAEI